MKVLLDIDGVMVTANSWRSPRIQEDGFYSFNFNASNSLKKILNNTGATILLTSSHKSRFDVRKWSDLFVKRGINAKVEKLKSNSLKVGRKNELINWIRSHPKEKFVIIDDDKSLNSLPSAIRKNLLLTSSGIGLTNDIANSAIEILTK